MLRRAIILLLFINRFKQIKIENCVHWCLLRQLTVAWKRLHRDGLMWSIDDRHIVQMLVLTEDW